MHHIHSMYLTAVLVVSAVAASTALAVPSMQTYVIDSFGGESLVSVIRPMLAEGGSVNSYQGRLVIRTTPSNYADIQRLLKQVDTTPKQLKLSLRVGENSRYHNRGVDVGDVVITKDPKSRQWGVGADIDVDYGNGSRNAQRTFTVNTLSGYRANIDSGTLLSLSQHYLGRYGVVSSKTLVPVTQGMSILPRQLPDGRVQLDVSQQYDRVNPTYSDSTAIRVRTGDRHHHHPRYPDARHATKQPVATQNSHTQVIVQPNQWVSIGNVVQQNNQSRTLGSSSSYVTIPIEVKVALAD